MNIDLSEHISLGSFSTNIQSTLMQTARYGGYLLNAYNKAEGVVGFVNLINSVRQVLGQSTVFTLSNASRRGIPNVDLKEAIESASYNLSRAIGTGVGEWA